MPDRHIRFFHVSQLQFSDDAVSDDTATDNGKLNDDL